MCPVPQYLWLSCLRASWRKTWRSCRMRFRERQQAVHSYLTNTNHEIMFSFGLLYYLSDLSCTFSQSFEWKRVAYRCILSAKVVLEAAALLTSSSSSLLEVCVRSLLLWYKAVQLLLGSAALCGEEIGKKVTEEVETESRSRGRKASLVACSQHISPSLSLSFYDINSCKFSCFFHLFSDLGHPEFFCIIFGCIGKLLFQLQSFNPCWTVLDRPRQWVQAFASLWKSWCRQLCPWHLICHLWPCGLGSSPLRWYFEVNSAEPHFIRCLKPNAAKVQQLFCWPKDRLWLVLEL